MEAMQVQERKIVEPPAKPERTRVVVTDFDMPFGSMVGFMVKSAIAAIPALLILTVMGLVFGAMFAGCFAAVGSGLSR